MLKIILGTTTEGSTIALESIYVEPQKSATISYNLISKSGILNQVYVMECPQYEKWGTDDTILYHIICARHKLQYKPFVEPEFIDETVVYRDEATSEMKCDYIKIPNPKYTGEQVKLEYVPILKGEAILQDDNRSVHNEADLQRIQTLQEQLDAQAAKLKTITDMLIGKGLV